MLLAGKISIILIELTEVHFDLVVDQAIDSGTLIKLRGGIFNSLSEAINNVCGHGVNLASYASKAAVTANQETFLLRFFQS